jgi:hypothetical protein
VTVVFATGTGSLAQMKYPGGGSIVSLFEAHDAAGVKVVDRAIVVVGCFGLGLLADAVCDASWRTRSLFAAMALCILKCPPFIVLSFFSKSSETQTMYSGLMITSRSGRSRRREEPKYQTREQWGMSSTYI